MCDASGLGAGVPHRSLSESDGSVFRLGGGRTDSVAAKRGSSSAGELCADDARFSTAAVASHDFRPPSVAATEAREREVHRLALLWTSAFTGGSRNRSDVGISTLVYRCLVRFFSSGTDEFHLAGIALQTPSVLAESFFASFSTTLRVLSFRGVHGVMCLPGSIGDCAHLTDLEIEDCGAAVVSAGTRTRTRRFALPPDLGRCPSLRVLTVRNCPIASVPIELGNCPSLECLLLEDVRELAALPEEMGMHGTWPALVELHLIGPCKINEVPASLRFAPRFAHLEVHGRRPEVVVPTGLIMDPYIRVYQEPPNALHSDDEDDDEYEDVDVDGGWESISTDGE
jgi:hypothetical protein